MMPSQNIAAPSSLAEVRCNIYDFLSILLLKPPSEKLLASLCEPELLANLEEIFGEATLVHFREFLKYFPANMEGTIQEYNDLFIVPLGEYVTPYEAVYREQREVEGKPLNGLLMGKTTVAVQESYRQANVRVTEDFLELPDHAGLEISFMGHLCKKQVEAMNQADSKQVEKFLQMQKNFLQEHLILWIPGLCARIRENAHGPFYKGVAGLLEAFMLLEAEAIDKFGKNGSHAKLGIPI